MKFKNSMIILIDAEKAFDKIQNTFMSKIISKVGLEGPHLNIIKGMHDKHCQHHNQWAKTTSVALTLGEKKGCLPSLLFFNIVLKVLTTAIRQEQEIKGIQIGK